MFSFPEEEEEEEEDDFLKLPSKNATLVDEHNMSYLESLGNILAATPKQKTIEEIPGNSFMAYFSFHYQAII